jgi:hypothetical protein
MGSGKDWLRWSTMPSLGWTRIWWWAALRLFSLTIASFAASRRNFMFKTERLALFDF